MKHFWMAVSIACLGAAAMSLWRQRLDAAFVIATVGALAWFLNYRARMKELLVETNSRAMKDGTSNQNED